ncbi:Crp/Fnr family transcriptional regulator [Pedobacter nototheniae]|uniref:Crp/Fnr family transcriptional regulator n=1 Tax=Pedobacter nototheniae TaxID=2488994 RepID=UPI00103EBB9B|nr:MULTISPECIES: Crp/Fnr family transcriptional regulator [Pedobacter]
MNPENIYSNDKWANYNGISPLISIFKTFHPLSLEIEHIINTQTFPVVFKKNKFISSPLHRNKYIFLVLKGLVRGYMKNGENEVTTWMARENELVGNIRNFMNEELPSEEYIQTIEEVIAVAVPINMTQQLYNNFDIANYVGRKMTELYYLQACERGFISRLQSTEKKYIRFIKSYPDLVDRAPIKHIASFLGMRVETLSRLRSRLEQIS